MKKLYSLWVLVFCLAFTSCHEEDALTPTEGGIELRFEVPQGNNSWDEDIAEIYNEYNVYLIYDKLTDADFNRTWTGGGLGATYQGQGAQSDKMAEAYVKFMKTHVFSYLKGKQQIYDKIFPLYWYMGYNVNAVSKIEFGTNVMEFHSPLSTKFDGLDYWSLCMFGKADDGQEEYFVPKTQKEYSQFRNMILGHILTEAVKNGNIKVPEAFGSGLDHSTDIKAGYGDEEDPNYYLFRGYPGTVNMTRFASIIAPDDGLPPTNENAFIGYITIQMMYNQEEIKQNYPADKYPLLAEKFKYVYNYMKDTYGIDLNELAVGPADWETCNIEF